MKFPSIPPPFKELFKEANWERALTLPLSDDFFHWDELRHRPPPFDLTHKLWWLALKLKRSSQRTLLPLLDTKGAPFSFQVPERVQQALHEIDFGAGKSLGMEEPITNRQTRNQYLVRSLIEEAVTSSQLEGAVTTRKIASEMIRTGREPRDKHERMILNNFRSMQRISEYRDRDLAPETVFEIHRLITRDTLEDPSAAGRLRRPDEDRVVCDDTGEVYHRPPPAEELPERLRLLCDFANGKSPGSFIHPVVRAILVHFWLAYDHPFVDGNGRTARALFYWTMLRQGYWLFEFISISNILLQAPVQYYRSFLHTETDDNDATYFLLAQTEVIRRAIDQLHDYIDAKTAEARRLGEKVRSLDLLNHRQRDLVLHALKHPRHPYTIASHQKSHAIVYQTARLDLLDLRDRGLLTMTKAGRAMIFRAPEDLGERLKGLGQSTETAPAGPPA